MKDILSTIITAKRAEVLTRKQEVTPEALQRQLDTVTLHSVQSMHQALASSGTGIIAEFKRKSPSKGWIFPDAAVDQVIPAYQDAGASACSVLTDNEFFGGSLKDLTRARELVGLPLLRKEFIVDRYQILEARLHGADAILLIASVLSPEECYVLAKAAAGLNLEVLLEIHTAAETAHINKYVSMIGINNRNLGTFETSIDHSFRLGEQVLKVSPEALLISESGISEAATVISLRRNGFRGFLIGETFMRGENPGAILAKFIREIQDAG